jgi:membrane protease YdiL (CAAX protease family)
MFEPPEQDPQLIGTPNDDAPMSFLDHWSAARWLLFALALLLLYQLAMVVFWNGNGGIGLLGLAAAPVVGIAVPLWLVMRRFGLSFRRQMRLTALSGRQFVGVVLSTLGIIPLAYALSVLNARYTTPVPEYWDFFKALQPEDAVGFVSGLLAVVVFVPLCEELLFRRVVQGVLERHLSTAVALLLSGFLFGAAHMTPWVLLPISALGVLLAVLAHRTRTITAPWLGHLLFNLFSFLELTLTGDPQTQRVEAVAVQPVPVLLGLVVLWVGIRLCSVPRQSDDDQDVSPPPASPW